MVSTVVELLYFSKNATRKKVHHNTRVKFKSITIMKKTLFFLTSFTLLLGLSSCQNDDDNSSLTDEFITSHIMGKWKRVEWNGVKEYTDERAVLTFSQNGKGYGSFTYDNDKGGKEIYTGDINYSVSDCSLTYKFTNYTQDASVSPVLSINDSLMTTKTTYTSGGQTVEGTSVYKKITADYTQTILGTWETSENNVQYRIEFLSDGSMSSYTKAIDGTWTKSDQTGARYVVDGDWLAIRYTTAAGVATGEYWDILSANSQTMTFSQYLNGSDKTRTLVLTKVK